jgi:hypothetical protein
LALKRLAEIGVEVAECLAIGIGERRVGRGIAEIEVERLADVAEHGAQHGAGGDAYKHVLAADRLPDRGAEDRANL